jgi:hypothetical protein
MWWDLEDYKSRTQVSTHLGDIAICQEFSNYSSNGRKDDDNFHIRTGQALFSWMSSSTSNSEHAAIVFHGWGQQSAALGKICDANAPPPYYGVAVRNWRPRPAYIYRCTVKHWAIEAARLAHHMATKAAGKTGDYSWKKAAKSVFKFKYVDDETRRYLNRCYEFAYKNRHHLDGMFCSEFVALCYILAARHLKLAEDQLGNLDVDPRAIEPKALQSLLERNDSFHCMGRPFHDGTHPAAHHAGKKHRAG